MKYTVVQTDKRQVREGKLKKKVNLGYETAYLLLTIFELSGYAIKSNAAARGSIAPPAIKIRGRTGRDKVSERRQAEEINEVNEVQNCLPTYRQPVSNLADTQSPSNKTLRPQD